MQSKSTGFKARQMWVSNTETFRQNLRIPYFTNFRQEFSSLLDRELWFQPWANVALIEINFVVLLKNWVFNDFHWNMLKSLLNKHLPFRNWLFHHHGQVNKNTCKQLSVQKHSRKLSFESSNLLKSTNPTHTC